MSRKCNTVGVWISNRTAKLVNIIFLLQCCQCRGLPAQLGYFGIACQGVKNCCMVGLKLGYFSSVCPWYDFFFPHFKFASFLSIQICFEPFQCKRTSFPHEFKAGIKKSWRVTNVKFQLHVENCYVFCFLFCLFFLFHSTG